jgi:metallo-beta-lactamase class B
MLGPLLSLMTVLAAEPADLKPLACELCAGWNQPQAPFKVYGNTWFVGPKGLSVVLVETPKGLVLLDGALPESVPLVLDHLKTLGKRIQDVKWIGISHAHYDHVGGVAALVRLSGAKVIATAHAAGVLKAGIVGADDPQVGFGEVMRFAPVKRVTVMKDGATMKMGDVTFTMHQTAGHTPGGTTWTWRSCEAGRCANMVYADSLNAVSAPGFRFSDHPRPVEQLRASMARLRALPCDILISAHPDHSKLLDRLAARERGQADAMFDSEGCRKYVEAASSRLERTLARETTGETTAQPAPASAR